MNRIDEIFNLLKSDNYYKVKDNVSELVTNHEFIKRLIKEKSPFVFDRFIKMCEYKIDTSVLYDERKKYIKKTLNKINLDNCHDILGLTKFDMILVNRYIVEYIITYYFQDNYYNFMTNFYLMVNYLKYNDKKLVHPNNIELYQRFVNLRKLSIEEMIRFFNEYLNENIMEMFYDDMEIVRTDSHKELVNHSLKLSKNNKIYQADISKKLDVDVYMLDGEKFYGFVRCFIIPRGEYIFNFHDYVNSKGKRLGYSFSYISDTNIGTSDYDGNSIALFYDNIDFNKIMYVHHSDLHSANMTEQDDYLSIKENEIMTPNSLIANTRNYNEIYIKSSKDGIKPTALICYDQIFPYDVSFAKKYNLSILVIKRDKYQRFETYEEDYDSNSYVI